MTLSISRSSAITVVVIGLVSGAVAGVETVEMQKVQVVRSVSGVVNDPAGVPIEGAVVAELVGDGGRVVRTVQTDENGYFSLPPERNQRIYLIRISRNGFNPLIVHVKTTRWTKKTLKLRLEIGT